MEDLIWPCIMYYRGVFTNPNAIMSSYFVKSDCCIRVY